MMEDMDRFELFYLPVKRIVDPFQGWNEAGRKDLPWPVRSLPEWACVHCAGRRRRSLTAGGSWWWRNETLEPVTGQSTTIIIIICSIWFHWIVCVCVGSGSGWIKKRITDGMDGMTYVNGPFVDFSEVESGISVTVDVAIQVRLQFGRRREKVERNGHQLPAPPQAFPVQIERNRNQIQFNQHQTVADTVERTQPNVLAGTKPLQSGIKSKKMAKKKKKRWINIIIVASWWETDLKCDRNQRSNASNQTVSWHQANSSRVVNDAWERTQASFRLTLAEIYPSDNPERQHPDYTSGNA